MAMKIQVMVFWLVVLYSDMVVAAWYSKMLVYYPTTSLHGITTYEMTTWDFQISSWAMQA